MREWFELIGIFTTIAAIGLLVGWQIPQFLRWGIMRLAMRTAYIEAGEQAAAQERKRLNEQGVAA